MVVSCADPGIFARGRGGQKKNSDNVFRHQLFYSLKEGYQWFILNKTIFFKGSRGVPTFYRGGGPNFSGRGSKFFREGGGGRGGGGGANVNIELVNIQGGGVRELWIRACV